MPYVIRKNKNGKFRVVNLDNNTVKAKNTTKKKAKAQIRLLYLIERNPKSVKRFFKKNYKNITRRKRRKT